MQVAAATSTAQQVQMTQDRFPLQQLSTAGREYINIKYFLRFVLKYLRPLPDAISITQTL